MGSMHEALTLARQQGGVVHGGGRITANVAGGADLLKPAIITIPPMLPSCSARLCPILYVMR